MLTTVHICTYLSDEARDAFKRVKVSLTLLKRVITFAILLVIISRLWLPCLTTALRLSVKLAIESEKRFSFVAEMVGECQFKLINDPTYQLVAHTNSFSNFCHVFVNCLGEVLNGFWEVANLLIGGFLSFNNVMNRFVNSLEHSFIVVTKSRECPFWSPCKSLRKRNNIVRSTYIELLSAWRKKYFEFMLNSNNLKGFCTEIDSFELANRRKSVKNGKQWKKHPKSDGSTPKNHHFSTVNIKL